jgi:hypothetical protein
MPIIANFLKQGLYNCLGCGHVCSQNECLPALLQRNEVALILHMHSTMAACTPPLMCCCFNSCCADVLQV